MVAEGSADSLVTDLALAELTVAELAVVAATVAVLAVAFGGNSSQTR